SPQGTRREGPARGGRTERPDTPKSRPLAVRAIAFSAGPTAIALGAAGWIQARIARAEVYRLTAALAMPRLPEPRAESPQPEEHVAARPQSMLGEGAVLDARAREDVELLITSLRREGAAALRRFPRAASSDVAGGDPLRVRGKLVPIAGTLGEVRYGNGFAAGRVTTAQGRDVYFATPLRLDGLAIGSPCVFEGLAVSVRWPS